MSTENADAFISHSSKDKNLFVRPLAEALSGEGAKVWFDEYSMKPGDSLSTSIDAGLSTSRHGIIVLSPNFIATAKENGWTQYEFRGLVANSIGPFSRRIIPVWLDLGRAEVLDWSPSLADLLAIDATHTSIEEVVLSLLEIIAPEKSGGLSRKRLLSSMHGRGKMETVDPKNLKISPSRPRRVPGHVPLRAVLVTQALADCGVPFASDLDAFVLDMSRDLHHEHELRVWEVIAATYLGTKSIFTLDQSSRRNLYSLLLSASLGRLDSEAAAALNPDVVEHATSKLVSLLRFVNSEVTIGAGDEGNQIAIHRTS